MQLSNLMLPGLGARARRVHIAGLRRKPKPNPETSLVAACLKILQLHGYACERRNSGSVPTKGGGRYQGAGAGTPDIQVVLAPRGRLAGVECKVPGKGLRKTQERWRARYEPLGALFGIATSARECLEMVEGWQRAERAR